MADPTPTPRDQISSIAGKYLSPQYGLTSDVVITELATAMAESNSAVEMRDKLRAILKPYDDDLNSLAAFVLRSDRQAGPNNG